MRKAIAIAIALEVAGATAHAQVRPNATWRQIRSENFTVIYEAGLDSLARHAAQRAEHEHALLSASLVRAPPGRIDIVIGDNLDLSNGNARPFPSNRVTIWARPPVEELSLQHYDDWFDLVISHELVHIFHHDVSGRVGRGLRAAFGRVPLPWPVFPVIGIADWNVEGLATYIESRHTNAGRVQGSYHEMVVRTASLDNAFPTIDRISGESPLWPGGANAYIYGSLFMDYIGRRYGERAHGEIIRKTAGSLLPPPWRMDAIARRAVGRSFTDLYKDWRAELQMRYTALADSLNAQGLTVGERMTERGRWALHARVAPDNRRFAYAEEDGRTTISTRIVDPSAGSDERVRRNGLGTVAWLPDNASFVTAQFDFDGPYDLRSDLYLVRSGKEQRLTKGARAESPDVSRDGKRIVYVQNAGGSNRLVMRELEGTVERVLSEPSPDVHWTLPRWHPAGDRIAVQRWSRAGGHDVVVLNMAGHVVEEIRTSGVDAAPAWSPAGRYLFFTSDRTGITNIYAHDFTVGKLWQISNVLGGAFYPDVSPDGGSIYYSGYHADGFHIERMTLDTAAWREPARAAPPNAQRRDTLSAATPIAAPPIIVTTPRAYSPLPSLLPKFWLPVIMLDTVSGEFLGAFTAGEDAVERHGYVALLAYDPWRERIAGDLAYTWSGLGNPLLTIEAARIWDNTGLRRLTNATNGSVDTVGTYEREDRISLFANILNRRWRTSSSLVLGVEGVVFNRKVAGAGSFRDPRDQLLGILAGAGFANYRVPALAISAEDGVRANLFVRHRYEIDPLPEQDETYTQITGSAAAYKSAGGGGYAHNVIGARGSALHRNALGPGPTDVGGSDGFLPVRGYADNTRIGFRAWTASLEYRLPLALIARGYRLRPLFIDRVAAAFFADAGNASCNQEERAVFLSCAGNPDRPAETLLSAGFELKANVAMLSFVPLWLRAGVGFPLRGEHKPAQVYLTFAPAF
ncbi:MAG: hypothetical protein ACT4O1_09740 [Gemmatimonadota bacterium]